MSKGNHNLYIATTIGMVALTAVCGGFLFSISASADDVVDQIEINIPVSCSMTGEGMDSHVTSLNNNETDSDFGATDVNVTCNDGEGFAIYAIGFTDDTEGKTVLTDSTLGSTHDIATGTATSGADSSWAMKLTTSPNVTYPISIENNYNTFQTVPSTYTMVAKRESATDIGASAEGANFTTSYQVYIGTNQIAGTYEGQVKYVLVHPNDADPSVQPRPSTARCINYFANASNAEGTMGCQSATDNASVELLASNFSRTGYGFAGWSDAYDYATNLSAHFYGPSETITAPVGTTANGLSLYAVWVKSEGSIQDTSKVASVCNRLTTAPTDGTANLTSVSALTDQRDNNTYAIAKLADGNCWMIENLRLESDAEHNSDGTLAQGYGGRFAGLADPETPDKFDFTYVANSLYSNDGANDTINIGISNTAYRMPRYNNVNTPTTTSDRPQNPTTNDATNTTSNASMYSYGNYYSWHAAIADTTAYTSNNTSVTNTSICPTGWRLPQGGNKTRIESDDDNDFWNLTVDALNNGTTPVNYRSDAYPYYNGAAEAGPVDKKLRSYPNNFVYSGYVNSGSVYNRGAGGRFWSSTAGSTGFAYDLDLSSSYVGPGASSYSKYDGRSVRCVVSGV